MITKLLLTLKHFALEDVTTCFDSLELSLHNQICPNGYPVTNLLVTISVDFSIGGFCKDFKQELGQC